MKKSLLLSMIFMLIGSMCFSQRVILDFESDTPDFGIFGADNWAGDPQFSVIANPDATGINPSDSVGQYLEPNEGEPWQGMYFDTDAPVELTAGQTELCADVWVDNAATFTIKLERSDGSFAYEPAPIDVTATDAWVEICQEFAGTDADGQTINRIVLFFNILSVPATPLIHYFDNITQPGADPITSTSNPLIDQRVRVFPNPTSDQLNFDFKGTSPATVAISDLTGKQILPPRAITTNTLDISDFSPGVYFVTLRDEHNRVLSTKKVIKQ